MTDPFIAEIRMFTGNFAPTGWALCNGQLLPISQNTALFSVLGTMYGGDGVATFALPNLQASAPIGQGQGPGLTPRTVGEVGGATAVTLTASQVAPHTHAAVATGSTGTTLTMGALAVGQPGPSQPHNNLQPYLVVNFIIALVGIFPSRS